MSKPNTVQHFAHNHPLTESNAAGTYTCDGCKLHGNGKTYRCDECGYDLHEYFATCPKTLANSWHDPSHELTLYSVPGHATERSCHVCRVYIEGMFYICKNCGFESHPLCTHGPMHIPSSPDHAKTTTITKERSLHVDHAAQPSSPQKYGHGPYPYGYTHMDPYGPYPHHHGGGGYHPYAYPYPYPQQVHNPYMNMGSPKAEHKKDSSSKGKKKNKGGVLGAVTGMAGAALSVVSQVACSGHGRLYYWLICVIFF